MEGISLRVGDVLYAVKKRWKLIIICTIIGFIIGIGLSGASYLRGTMTRNYKISSSAVFLASGENGTYPEKMSKNPAYSDYRLSTDMTYTVGYILKSEKLLKKVIDNTDLVGIKPRDIQNNLQIMQQGESSVVEITLTWRSSEEGIKILNSMMTNSSSVLKDILDTGKLSVIDPPKAQYIVGGGISAPIWGIMLVIGFLMGIGITILDALMRPTLINIKDVQNELQLETIGSIRKDDEFFENDDNTIYGEPQIKVKREYSAAAHILMNRLGKRKVFYVTSSINGEGKTSVVANLATQFANMEKRTLMIDLNAHNPRLGNIFLNEVKYENSLNALYRGDAEADDVIMPVNGYLDILPTILEHNSIPIDKTIIELIENLIPIYDYIIIDAPSIDESSDILSLNSFADSALLVIGYDMATKQKIKDMIDTLDKAGTKLLGCIINQEKISDDIFENKKKYKGTAKIKKPQKTKAVDDGTVSTKLLSEMYGDKEQKEKEKTIEDLIEFGLKEDDDD